MKRLLKILRIFVFALLALILLVWLLIQTEIVQNYFVSKITGKLSDDLKTEVSIQHVSISFFNKLNLEKLLVRDQQKDTLLYAGQFKVRLTDWFIFKDHVTLKYIGLEDAVIKLQRPDSVWNYEFIVKHFSSPSQKDTTSKPFVIDFKKVDFKNITFLNLDHYIGTRQTIKAGSALLDISKVDFNTNDFIIDEILLDRPQFLTEEFDGIRPPRHLRPPEPLDTSTANLSLKVGNIKIKNGSFFNTNLTDGYMNFIVRKPENYFDGRYIHFFNINAGIKDVFVHNDTLTAQINLSTKERSGFTVNQLKAKMKMTPNMMEFADLRIKTPKSDIKEYYAMHYDDFHNDMGEFITNVFLKANFTKAHVHSDDIAFFAPELKNWNKQFDISGKFNGHIDDFTVKNIAVSSGKNTFVRGSVSSKGLPDIDHTVFVLQNGQMQTSYADLVTVMPALKRLNTPDLPALGVVKFNGSFSGSIYNFLANGMVTTNLGNFSTNVFLKLPFNKEPVYKGTIRTSNFNLGKFIKEPLLGPITFNGKVDGVGFSKKKMRTSLEGHISRISFKGYDYHTIDINGMLQKSYFNGELKADDPNFNFTSSLEIDLTTDIPKFNILGDLVNADLKKLNFVNQNLSVTGLLDLNFSGRNIDEFEGSAKLLNASIKKDSFKTSFDSLSVFSDYFNGEKRLSILSDDVRAIVKGNFSIMEFPASLQAFLHRYYPSYISSPGKILPRQNFDFSLKTKEFDKYVPMFDKRLGGLNNVEISGTVNTIDTNLLLHAKVPYFTYNNYIVENADVEAVGNLSYLDIKGLVGLVVLKDSLRFPNTQFTINSQNDHSRVHIATRANTTLNEADFNADVFTYSDGLAVHLNESSFVLNDKKWDLQDEGIIVLRKSILTASDVKFVSGLQQIAIESVDKSNYENSALNIQLTQINIDDFVPYLFNDPKLEGIANGNIIVKNIFSDFSASANLIAEQFRMNNDSIGLVQLQAHYPEEKSKIAFSVQSPNNLYSFSANGSFDLKSPIDEAFQTALKLNDANISLINQFVSSVFSNLKGQAKGELVLKGNPSSPYITGEVNLTGASLKVNYTNVEYFVDNANVLFVEDGIDFGTLRVKDRNGNNGTIRGKLYHQGFKNLRFDFDFSSPNILALETTAGQNDNFYGKAIGKVNMSLKGTDDDVRMAITAQTSDSTHIVLPPSSSRESGEADYIIFKEYGKEEESILANSKSKLSVHLDLVATNQAQVDIILDDLSGDIIKAVGNGRLRMDVDNGNVKIFGRYNIESGSYDFNFQSFIPKKFELKGTGENYIEWSGDASDARINLTAQYTAENISLNDLIGNQNLDISGNLKAYKGDVYVIALLSGKLESPKIDFKIDFPASLAFRNDPTFAQFLNKLESDPSEMVKQVTWLIVFKSFAPYGEIRTGIDVKKITLNSISQQISNQINKMVSDLLFKWTGDKSLQFEIGGSTYSSSQLFTTVNTSDAANLDRQRVNLKLNKKLLDGRIIISVGSDIDFYVGNTTAAQSGNLQLLPDVSAEFILTPDKKLRAIIFSKSSLDINKTAIGRRNRQGIGLSYSRDWGKTPPLKKPVAARTKQEEE